VALAATLPIELLTVMILFLVQLLLLVVVAPEHLDIRVVLLQQRQT
jgi:hypothetical protein